MLRVYNEKLKNSVTSHPKVPLLLKGAMINIYLPVNPESFHAYGTYIYLDTCTKTL